MSERREPSRDQNPKNDASFWMNVVRILSDTSEEAKVTIVGMVAFAFVVYFGGNHTLAFTLCLVLVALYLSLRLLRLLFKQAS